MLDWYLVDFWIRVEISTALCYSKACETTLKTDSVTDFKNKFQNNYKVTRMTLVEPILLPYCRRLIDMFLFPRVLPYATTQRKTSRKTSRNFQRQIFLVFMTKQQSRPQTNLKEK